jgi:hypothetical protein
MHTRWLAGVLLLRQIPVCSSYLENKLAGRVGHPSLCDAGAYSCEVTAMSIKNIERIKKVYPAEAYRPTVTRSASAMRHPSVRLCHKRTHF